MKVSSELNVPVSFADPSGVAQAKATAEYTLATTILEGLVLYNLQPQSTPEVKQVVPTTEPPLTAPFNDLSGTTDNDQIVKDPMGNFAHDYNAPPFAELTFEALV